MTGVSATTTSRPALRRTVAAIALLVLMPLLAGCLRVQVSMGISKDDLVTGQLVVATQRTTDDDEGPQLQAPSEFGSKVRISPYAQDGYVGSRALFDKLTFAEVGRLGELYPDAGHTFALTLRRSGDSVLLEGTVDLTSLPSAGADIELTAAFPAAITSTNGSRQGDSMVSWNLPAGDSSRITAEARYRDPHARSFAGWMGIVGGFGVAVAIVVAGLAYVARNRD